MLKFTTLTILLYGGSFDPPHDGHLRMIQAAVRRLRPDRVYLIPSFHSPFKSVPRGSAVHRTKMLRLLLNEFAESLRPNMKISRFELKRRRKTFTCETLRYFQKRHPRSEIWFLIGGDLLPALSRWKHAGELKRRLRWAVGRRPSGPRIHFPRGFTGLVLPGVMPNASSTEIRSRLFAGEAVNRLTPKSIETYIRRHRLYGLNLHRDLERSLDPDRCRHTVCVARLARRLAVIHGLSPEKAALAGLLHDCGRRLNLARMVRYTRKHRLQISFREDIIKKAPLLLHAFISERWALERYRIVDAEVLSAIRNHTLGEIGMPRLDRLLYVADISAEGRGLPEAKTIRRLAFQDLEAACLKAVETKKRRVVRKGYWLHPGTDKLLAWARRLAHDRASTG